MSSQAATISVNTLADNTTNGDSLCTLREAIISANTGSAGSSGCTITGVGTSYIIQLVGTGTINLASELPQITSDIIFKQSTSGASAGNFVIKQTGVGRIVEVISGTVQFIDLSMVSGNAINGGALYINSGANVTLVNVAIQGNTASNSGGGIYNNGTLTLQTNSVVKGNTASISGGGIHNQSGTLTIDASQVGTAIDPNRVNGASGSTHVGGGIANFNGTLNLSNASKVCQNTVVYSSGDALGGGIYSSDGTVTVDNSEVCNNSTDSSTGQSHGAGIYSIATTGSGTNLTIQSGSKVYGNIASGLTVNNRGGGIYQTGSRDLVISAAFIGTAGNPNTATYGAGIYNDKSNVTIQSGTEVCYNEASNSLINSAGGGIYNDTGNTNNQLQINNSTFCFNTTNGSSSSAGGAIANYGSGSNPNLVIQNNSQFYGNQVTGSPYPVGGAIYNNSTAGVTIDNSTIGTAANPNKAQDGAGIYNGVGVLTVQNNSIIGYNVASGNGGAIKNSGSLSLSGSKLLYNIATSGGALYQNTAATATIGTNNCIVQNNSSDDVFNADTLSLNMNGVWWGSNDGASGGSLTGHGDSLGSNISQGSFLTTAPTGCPDPKFSSNPVTGTVNIGVTPLGTPTSTAINISELGDADLWMTLSGGSLATALTGANPADFTITSGTFPLQVAQNSLQTITVQCTPSALGTRTATLTLETNASLLPTGNNQKIYNLQCSTPAASGFASTPTPSTPLNFGSVTLGSSATQNITVSETGSAALNVSLASLSGANAGDFSVSGLPFKIIDGGAARNIGVACTPTAAGTRTATLSLSTDDPANITVSYPLSCTGIAAPPSNPVFNSNPLPSVGLSFGNVSTTTGVSQTISITNTGTATLSVSLSSLGGANASDFNVNGLPLNIVNGTPAQNITVSCKPSALGTRTATLNLNTNDPAQVAVSYNLSCTAAGTTVCDTQTQIPLPQCNALLNLYNSANGANWTDKASNQWLTPLPCNWAGVTCVAGQVVALNRSQQNLIGTFPNLTGLAASLTVLNLSDNQLAGILPDFLSFSKLQDLNLGGNLLGGAIVGMPSSLKTLRLDNNQLEGIIPDLTPLSALTLLNLDFNKLTGETAGSATLKQAVWRATQTVMPSNVKATPLSSTQVQVTWTPISYLADTGYYRVKYATTAGGPYTVFPTTTSSKSVNTLTVTGLTANTQYFFVVETLTLAHLRQRSVLISPISAEVAAKTLTVATKFSTIPAIGSTLNLGIADFGNPSTSSVTVINLSSTALTVTASISGTNASDFSVTPSSTTIAGSTGAALQQQLFVVQCRPASTSFGALSATLNLATNDPTQANVTYPLTCQSNNKQVVNNPPTDITLSNSSISDSLAGGGLVGLLKTQDADVSDSFTYTLIDNASGVFVLNGNELHTTAGTVLDGVARPNYTIKVRSTDSGGLFIEKSLTISVLSSLNSLFTGEIASNSGTIASNLTLEASENFTLTGHIQPDNRHVGQSASLIVTYTWNNAGTTPRVIPVTLAKNQVLTAKMDLTLFQGNLTGLSGVFNVHLSYRLDSNGKEMGGDIARLELQANHAPTDISLSASVVSEDSVNGSLIGKLSTVDVDKRDHFVYGLVGSEQFVPFKIVGDELRVTNSFLLNAKTSPQYQLTVRSVDSFGSFTEKNFTINVQTADSLPTEIGLTNHSVLEASHYGAVVGRLFTRERHPYSYQYELLDDAAGRFALHEDLLIVAQGDLLQYEVQAQHTVKVRSTNVTTGKTLEQSFTIDLINIPNIHVQASFLDAQGNGLNKLNFAANEFLNLALRLYPESTHQGKTVDLILVGVFIPNDATNNDSLFMLTPELNLATWDGDFAHLQSAGKMVLDMQHDFPLWNAALPALNGKLAIFLGYRLDSGEVFYQPQAISLEIH